MTKEKESKVIDVEVEPIEEIQAEVNEAAENKEAKMKKKFFTKDNAKKLGKDALKVLGGAVIGAVGVFTLALALKDENTEGEMIEIQSLESGEEPVEIHIEV